MKDDIIRLSKDSSLVKKMLDKGRKVALIEQQDFMPHPSDFESAHEYFTFHPNGNCGCCLLPDDYMFGIRCNHLMWAEGFCEGGERFWENLNLNEDECEREWGDDCVLIYGNHKGFFIMKLLVFY